MVNILHIIPGVGPSSFGLGPAALNLAREQNALGHSARIWSLDPPDEARDAAASARLDESDVRVFPVAGPRKLGFSPLMERQVSESASGAFDIIHQHSVWMATSRVTSKWRELREMPTMIAAHGALDSWTLRRSKWRKVAALAAYERANLCGASCLHAVAESEISSYRAFGLTNPVALIPTGVSEDWIHSSGDGARFRNKFRIPPDKRVMLFVSRIAPKKGLPMLLEAMSRLKPRLVDWVFVVAGADESGHEEEVRQLVRLHGLESWVRFVGPVFGQDKRDAMECADIFVLTSHSEGAPAVVLEALGVGLPVFVTDAVPRDILPDGCGWRVKATVDAVRDVLDEVLECPCEELRSMGRVGMERVSAENTWRHSAQRAVGVYQWLLGESDKPDYVTT